MCACMILMTASACGGAVSTTPAFAEDIPSPVKTSSESPVTMVMGVVENIGQGWPEREVTLFAATFTGATESEGYFVLEPDQNPHTAIKEDGTFILSDIPAGQYILLAGPTAEEALKLLTENGDGVIFQIENDQQLEIGSTFLPKQ